ncbi:hypothetical protein D3P09_10715 [Paenibacillus pinisoli]|uniref:Sulfatase-modifying factor enzyme domain-containing protein n=1 Tax=Paenibacillus pinisoli TaxID=1276110 RepID=A0A3A6PKN9_9BACL|nr:hypothetical protein [Paenibacillus pinisoli]RJX39858.1 hypothetical protein D3P09_10715 [Paenibacillus pinisoli]
MRLDGLYADEWEGLLADSKKERIVRLLSEHNVPFDLAGMKIFSAYGVESETALLDWQGRKFVFVPGRKSVMLGWDSGIDSMKEGTRREIGDGFEEVDGLNDYINKHTSPIRTVDIPPMIVECELNEVGLVPVGYVDRGKGEHQVEEDYLEQVEDYLYEFNTEHVMTEYSETCRFQRSEDDPMVYHIYAFDYTTREDLLAELQRDGFTLLTEDQWEYLCGAGQRTLFPFGGRFDEEVRYAHLSETGENVLEQPNGLGVTIAYDPYKYEIVDSECLVKGGDGGSALCGGEPFIYMMLPLATYWRDAMAIELAEDEDLATGYYFYRRAFVVK